MQIELAQAGAQIALIRNVEVTNNYMRSGMFTLALHSAVVEETVRVEELYWLPTTPTCVNAFDEQYGSGTCKEHIESLSLSCSELFCHRCAYAHRCDLYCNFCEETLGDRTMGVINASGLEIGGNLTVRQVALQDSVDVWVRQSAARTIWLDDLNVDKSTDQYRSHIEIINCTANVAASFAAARLGVVNVQRIRAPSYFHLALNEANVSKSLIVKDVAVTDL